MNALIVIASLLVGISAQAKINVSALVTMADSTDAESTNLMATLKSAGVKGYVDHSGYEKLYLTGSVTVTNGAGCDNGHETYAIDLNELDYDGKPMQTVKVDGSTDCKKPSRAEKLFLLLNRWGGSTIQLDCGAGHCWESIKSIECTRFPASKGSKAFDSCSVSLSSGV